MILVLAFLAIAFLAILQLLSGTIISSGELKGSVVAQNLANQKMEELMNLSFASLSSEAKITFADFPTYSYMVEVASLEANLKTIKVAVFWEVAGAEMSFTVDTMLTGW
jgi:hypothetical protein